METNGQEMSPRELESQALWKRLSLCLPATVQNYLDQ